MLKWVDKLPVKPLLVVAVFFALVPFQPEPHLFEKLRGDYPVRREFDSYQIKEKNVKETTLKKLKNLGFIISG